MSGLNVARRRLVARSGLVAASVAVGHWPAARAQVQTIRIGREDYASSITGVQERLVLEAFARIDVRSQIVHLPLLRLIEMANDGQVDGDTGRIAEVANRFPNLLLVPTPICQVDVAVYGRTPDFARRTRSEIAAMNIGIVRGIFVLAKYSQGMKVTEAQHPEAIMSMLLNGRIDAAIAVYLDVEDQLQARPTPEIVRWPYLWASEPLHCLLHKRHAALVPRLDAALAAMAKEGVIARTYAQELKKLRVVPLLPMDAAPR